MLILPGLVNGDRSNIFLRRYLIALGYRAEGCGGWAAIWARARSGRMASGCSHESPRYRPETGEKVTLVGVSLAASWRASPRTARQDMVREVITISSPFAGSPRSTNGGARSRC